MLKSTLKNGRKASGNGQAKKSSVVVKAKIKRTSSDDMEFAVSEPVRRKKVVTKEAPVKKLKKKRSVEATVVQTLKRQIEESRALTVAPVMELSIPQPKRISKLNDKGGKMRSILGDEAENIHQLLEVGDADNATSLIYKRSLQVLVDLLPYAEHQVRATKGQRGVYQVNSLIQSVRELMVDLQSAQDRGAMGEMLIEKVVRPVFLDIGMAVVREMADVAASAKGYMPDAKFELFKVDLKDAKERIGREINLGFENSKEQTRQFLQR